MIFTRKQGNDHRRRTGMKKLTMLVAMMALMTATFAAPGMAKAKFNSNHSGGSGFFISHGDGNGFHFNANRGVSFDLGDTENESGDIETENNFAIEGNTNNACLGQLQFANTGNFTNQQGSVQFFSGADDIEFEGGEIGFAPENETACEGSVEQATAASSF
jgi:hypothetical protein